MKETKFLDIVLVIIFIALVTTLILPNRQTPQVIRATGRSFSDLIRTVMALDERRQR